MRTKLFSLTFILACFSASAQTNYALSFNGTTDYVSIGTPLASGSSYTKEAWIYLTTTSGSRNIISSLNTPFWISSGTLSAGQAGSYSLVTGSTALSVNKWIYVAVTYDAATTTMKLYQDGTLLSTNTSVAAYTAESTFIGTHQGTVSFLQGYADEVRIWNTALTQAQLKQNMYQGPTNNATGLVAYYKCNAGSGTVLASSCTNTTGLDGTLQGSTSWTASPVQSGANAVSFDGTDDVIDIPSNSSLNITSAITLEAWVYATKNSGVQNVINKSSNTVNTGYIFPRTDNGWTNAVFYLHIGGWTTLSVAYPSLNAWHHLAATYDGATMKIYIDGVLAGSKSQTGSITTNSNVLSLGNQTGFSEYFGGNADEFRIWNVARTQTEIQNNMNKELDPATQTGLVSYYRANQGIAAGTNTGLTTIVDMSGTNNGTMSNFALSGSSSNFVSQNSAITVLPVSFTRFTAEEKHKTVLLQWSTASEQNSKDFIIEHSANRTSWTDIDHIPAAGNSSSQRDYNYIHTNPVQGMNYYRIRERDIDGRNSYSEIRSVKFRSNETLFTVLSNPVTNRILQIKLSQPANLSLYDNDGKLLWRKQFNDGYIDIDMRRHASGIYILKAENQTEKLILY